MRRLISILIAVAFPVAACFAGDFEVKGSVGTLRGNITLPDGAETPCPTVIICHGLTGHQNEAQLLSIRDSLLKEGYAVVKFDFNGHGSSDGPFSGMTLDNELEDLSCIYDYVQSLPEVDPKRIAVCGHSQGGLEAGVFAGDNGVEKVKCVILLAPAACIHSMAVEGNLFGYDISENMPDSIKFWEGKYLSRLYAESARRMDVLARSSAYAGPVLILQGERDSKTLIRDAKRYCDYLPNASYIPLPGLSHCFPEDLALPAKLSTAFIKQNL